MPAAGPVMKVPCSITRTPSRTRSMGSLLLDLAERPTVIGDGLCRMTGEDETDRPAHLLVEMGNEACRTRQDRNALQGGERESDIQDDCGNGAGNVHGQIASPDFRDEASHFLDHR